MRQLFTSRPAKSRESLSQSIQKYVSRSEIGGSSFRKQVLKALGFLTRGPIQRIDQDNNKVSEVFSSTQTFQINISGIGRELAGADSNTHFIY